MLEYLELILLVLEESCIEVIFTGIGQYDDWFIELCGGGPEKVQALYYWKAASIEGFQFQLLSWIQRKTVLVESPGMNSCR